IGLANQNPGPDTIRFNIPGVGVQTIVPTATLPPITGPVTIDGFSQPDSRPNTRPDGSDAALLIQVSGPNAGVAADGLTFGPGAGGSIVRGLVINQFAGAGIVLDGSDGIRIVGNFLGTDDTGT